MILDQAANLGSAGITRIRLGTDNLRMAMDYAFDRVEVTR